MWMICRSCNCIVSIVCILDYNPACGMYNSSNCCKIHSHCLPVMCSMLLPVGLSVVFGTLLPVTDMLCLVYVLCCKVGLSSIGSPCLDYVRASKNPPPLVIFLTNWVLATSFKGHTLVFFGS